MECDPGIRQTLFTGKERIMKKYVCSVCGYVHEGFGPPDACPQCNAPAEKFQLQGDGDMVWVDEHKIVVAQGVDEEVVKGLRENFMGECTEGGM